MGWVVYRGGWEPGGMSGVGTGIYWRLGRERYRAWRDGDGRYPVTDWDGTLGVRLQSGGEVKIKAVKS